MKAVSAIPRQRYVTVVALGVVLLLAATVRLHDLEKSTVGHNEIYVPGIDLPWDLSNPHPRFTVWQTIASTVAGEPHPPGYYLLMTPWTRWVGGPRCNSWLG